MAKRPTASKTTTAPSSMAKAWKNAPDEPSAQARRPARAAPIPFPAAPDA